jgi:hypothetical protein
LRAPQAEVIDDKQHLHSADATDVWSAAVSQNIRRHSPCEVNLVYIILHRRVIVQGGAAGGNEGLYLGPDLTLADKPCYLKYQLPDSVPTPTQHV